MKNCVELATGLYQLLNLTPFPSSVSWDPTLLFRALPFASYSVSLSLSCPCTPIKELYYLLGNNEI